jgi:uncharacterized protein YqgC (DUF456 family)
MIIDLVAAGSASAGGTTGVATTLIAGLLVLVGIVGIVLPVLPGLILVVAGIAVWAIPRGDALGWWVLGIAVAIVVIGTVAKYLLPGRALRESGVPTRSIVAGVALGIVGFFVIPVVGLFLGFPLGVFLAELSRLGTREKAWPSTRRAISAVGFSILLELATGLLAVGVWVVALIFFA